MSKLRIGIFGSAPNARLDDCDVGYFANYSAQAFPKNEINSKVKRRVAVMSTSARFSGSEAASSAKTAQKAELVARNEQIGFQHSVILAVEPKQNIFKGAAVGSELFFDSKRCDALLHETTNTVPPIWNRDHFRKGLRVRPSKGFRIWINSILKPSKLSPYLRPSTGLFTLAYAIEQHKSQDADFFVSGISFVPRDQHSVHGEVKSARDWYAAHVAADSVCFERMCRHHKIELR